MSEREEGGREGGELRRERWKRKRCKGKMERNSEGVSMIVDIYLAFSAQ